MTNIGALQILFIALKLTDVINWSWWVVLLPLILSLIIALIKAIGEVKLD